jgi:hypothetical protein
MRVGAATCTGNVENKFDNFIHQELGVLFSGSIGSNDIFWRGAAARHLVIMSLSAHWAIDDVGEKVWIATPHLSSSSFSTRTTRPVNAWSIKVSCKESLET